MEVAQEGGHILVVDDNKINRLLLQRLLENQGHRITQAENGVEALTFIQNQEGDPIDVVLLDIMMPEMDGYELLTKIKDDPKTSHLPVIMVSALDELDSVVRCIEIGATDYLTKPVQPTLLRARLNASLAEKRLRDLEMEYLEQVGHVIGAAEAVQSNVYNPESLAAVSAREDALGNLARVFQRMAQEVHLREQRLKHQLAQLRLDMEEMHKALTEPIGIYLPMDRRHALVRGETLPDRGTGAVLFADISGFTPITAAFSQELGHSRGAEETTRLINQIFNALVAELHRFGGSVIGFSGDAITCWIDQDDGLRAAACGVAMQKALEGLQTVVSPVEKEIQAGIKVVVAAGPVRRFLAGDPENHWLEVLAGKTLNVLALAEKQANQGEVLVDSAIAGRHPTHIQVAGWRTDAKTGQRFAIIGGISGVSPQPWPDLPEGALSLETCRPWLHPIVYRQVIGSSRQFLSELRPAATLFLQFRGVDYDGDEKAGHRLDAYIRWVQAVISDQEGAIVQITFGDKGSYLQAAFGAPLAHTDDAARAVRAALTLFATPVEFGYITGVQIGVTFGEMRSGAYGGSSRRTYGVMGNRTNLAARFMEVAELGILCDQTIYDAARGAITFEELPPIRVKGRGEAFSVYRPIRESLATPGLSALMEQMDQLSPDGQLALKLASVIGDEFDRDLLAALFSSEGDSNLSEVLQGLENAGLIVPDSGAVYRFAHSGVREAAYNAMLFAQRRPLHRQIAEWLEKNIVDLVPLEETLAHHWQNAEDLPKALQYLEKAAHRARKDGKIEKAEQLFQGCLALEAQLSASRTGI
jgi:CheY-like chemotaxis protein